MKQQKTDTLLFKILFLVALAIIVAQTQGMGSLTSNLFLLTFPMTVALWLRSARKTVTVMDLVMLLTAAVAAVNVLINAAATGVMPGFSYIKKLIMFVMTILFFRAVCRLQVERSVIRFVNRAVDLLAVYLIFMFAVQTSRMFLMNGRVSVYLTFRFSNPNLTGLFLTCLYMLELCQLLGAKGWQRKLVHIVLAVFLAVFVVLTQARNALMILLLFTGCCGLLALRRGERLGFGKILAAAVAVFPILFVGAYVALVYTPWIQETFSFMVGEGKGLDSRMEIWGPALENLAASPLIGAYSQISGGTGTGQMHNTHLDVACSYGIPVLVLVCVLLWDCLHQNGRGYTRKGSFIYVVGFACAILLGMGEAALFSGGLGLYVFVGSFLLMANHTEMDTAPLPEER